MSVPDTAERLYHNENIGPSPSCNTNDFLFVYETEPLKHGVRQGVRAHVRKRVAKQFKLDHKGGHNDGINQGQYPLLAAQKSTESAPVNVADSTKHSDSQGIIKIPVVGLRNVDESLRNPPEIGGALRSRLPTSSRLVELPEDCYLGEERPCHCSSCRPPKLVNHRTKSKKIVELARKSAITTSPLEILGAGRVDPFMSLPDEKPTRFGHEMIDHLVMCLGPGFMLDGSRIDGSKIAPDAVAKTWFSSGLKRPILYHALIFANSVHVEFLRTSKINTISAVALSHKLTVIRELKKALENLDETYTDDIMFAMLILAVGESLDTLEGRDAFQAPFRSLAWLDFYGSLKSVPEHMLALLKLIHWRGGLEKIELPGLAEVMVRGDVCGATRALRRPVFPPLRASVDWIARVVGWAMSLQPPNQPLGQNFLQYQDNGLDSAILSIIIPAIATSHAIDHFVQGKPNSMSLPYICKARTSVQRNLMDLTPAGERNEYSFLKPCVYEVCRLTLIIYGAGVIFPIMHPFKVFQVLVQRLKMAIESENFEQLENGASEIFLWILVLGGIAALDKPERKWFVQQLVNFVEKSGIRDWQNVEQILVSFLWMKRACSQGGRQLWSEVLEMSYETSSDTTFLLVNKAVAELLDENEEAYLV